MLKLRKKFYATTSNALVTAAFLSFLTTDCVAGPTIPQSLDCGQSEQIKETSTTFPGRSFTVTACGGDDSGGGIVEVVVSTGGKPTQRLSAPYHATPYITSLDTNIDIDTDGIPDLAVATGAGRAGDGMYYWRYSPTSDSYISAGEAPSLMRCKDPKSGSIYNISSSTGDYQPVRTEYRFLNGQISPVSAIGFAPIADSDTYRIFLLEQDAQGYFSTEQAERIVPAASIDSYMDDTCRWPEI